MTDINLLPVEEKEARSWESIRGRLRMAATVVLLVTGVFTFGTLVFLVGFLNQKGRLTAQIEESVATINSLKSAEELTVVTKGKVKIASQIIEARTNHPQFLGKVAALVPGGIYFTDIKFSGAKIVMVGRARSSAEVGALVSALTSVRGKELISGVSVDSLSSDESGIYSFTLTVMIAGGAT